MTTTFPFFCPQCQADFPGPVPRCTHCGCHAVQERHKAIGVDQLEARARALFGAPTAVGRGRQNGTTAKIIEVLAKAKYGMLCGDIAARAGVTYQRAHNALRINPLGLWRKEGNFYFAVKGNK